jgi:uncharacterized protein YggT (Ycf19 family)
MKDSNTKEDEIVVPGYLKFSKVIVWLLYFWVMIGVVSLSLRVFLLAFSASTQSSFVEFVYKVSSDYLQPFRGIWPPRTVNETGYLDVAAIFAIIVYLFIAWGFRALIDYVQGKIDATVAEQEKEILSPKLRA